MNIRIEKITNQDPAYQEARNIREKVFIIEQKVPVEDEYDEFEESSRHFIAYLDDDEAVGTARWRFTEKGAKLERFAVLAEHRGNGVGGELVKAVLEDISGHPDAAGKKRYLHSQVDAVNLYARKGFKPQGDQFDECGIMHYYMEIDGRGKAL